MAKPPHRNHVEAASLPPGCGTEVAGRFAWGTEEPRSLVTHESKDGFFRRGSSNKNGRLECLLWSPLIIGEIETLDFVVL
jgi:hypothetical protein